MSDEPRIITEPRVYLVGRTQIDRAAVQRFLDDEAESWITDTENGAELISELAGRLCYMAFSKRQGRRANRDYLANIIRQGHGSVLEHVVWNFIVTGVSRSMTHELVRHRAGWAYSMQSQRFVDESHADFIEPAIIASERELHQVWLASIRQSRDAYCSLAEALAAKVEREHASLKPREMRRKIREAGRSVLPNATATRIMMSANARALRHFIEYRGAPEADPEIRRVAIEVLEIMRVEAPAIFGDYEIRQLPDGSASAETACTKV